MASNQPISSAAICSSRVSGCHAGCAGSGAVPVPGRRGFLSVSGAGCSGAARTAAQPRGRGPRLRRCVSGAVCWRQEQPSALRQAASAFSARALACSSCSHACSQAASSSVLSCFEGKQGALKGEHPGLIPAHLGACRSQLAAQLLCSCPGAFRLCCGRCLYSGLPGNCPRRAPVSRSVCTMMPPPMHTLHGAFADRMAQLPAPL